MKRTLLILFIIAIVNTALPAQETGIDYYEQGMKHYQAGEYDAAIADFEAATKLEPELSIIWKELGNVYISRGSYDAAIENYNRAIQIDVEFDMEEPEVYAKRGEAYNYKGNYDAVIADYTQAIRLDGENAQWWNNRGEAYRSKGDYDQAIEHFMKAINFDKNNAHVWNNLGYAYYGKGDYDQAIENFNKAIEIDKSHAQAWNNRGAAYLEKGEYDRAIADFTQVLKFNADYEYAIIYSNRSRAYRMKKEYKKALADCDAALKIDRNYAPALNNRAHTYREMGQYKKALAAYRECLDAAAKSININDISAYAWFLAGQVYEKYPYLKGGIKKHSFWSKFAGRVALDGISRGIKNAEDIRQNMGVQGADLMAQMIYLYYAGVDLEAVLGSPENVLFYSESLRSRGFLEQVGAEAAIRLAGVTEEERNQFMKLRAVIEEQQAIISTYDSTKLEGEANERYALAIRKRKDAEEALARLDKEIGSHIPKYTELRNPKPVTLNQAKTYCGKDRAVLEYVLWDASAYKPIKGAESWNIKGDAPAINSYCLVITKDGLTAVPLSPDFDYFSTIQKLRNGFERWSTSPFAYEQPRNDLYNQLIKPVLPYLKNITNITIVPDGDLSLIPFDILRANETSKDFGESYVISLSPSLSVSILARKDENMQHSPILFFANDVYAGRRDNNGNYWTDLEGVRKEIIALTEFVGGQNKEFFTCFREDATKENIQLLSKAELKRYPVIHFACHGYFNKEKPTESGLVLYQVSGDPVNENGYLTIPEVAALELDARMVVLSACETGLSEAKVGEGMVGLARAFMVAGAGSVGVSLWKIDDTATILFMKSLYRKVLEEGKQFRESYKEVRESFRKGTDTLYTNPYFWAAFTIYE
jgi:tetratricopeptide (TPR) repeat protein